MEYVLLIGNNIDVSKYDFKNKYIIGIDAGALFAIKNEISLDIAIGDFDSITKEDFKLLETKTRILKLPCQKDETDTESALKLCKNASKIIIIGGIQGKRIEHFIANMNLLIKNPIIEIIDDNSYLKIIDKPFKISNDDYKYVSFFAIEDIVISLKGFKYPLEQYKIEKYNNIAISNEIIDSEGLITIHSGKALVILSKDDHYEKIF